MLGSGACRLKHSYDEQRSTLCHVTNNTNDALGTEPHIALALTSL